MWAWLFIFLVTVLVIYFTAKLINYTFFWQRKGIPYLVPWPIIGNVKDVVFRRKNFAYLVQDLYKEFPNKRYYGMFQFVEPFLVIKDLDLIKKVTIKDFDHFVDRLKVTDSDLEPLFGKNLLMLQGQKWKDMRATLSPTFTGNKIREMFNLMSECAKQFNEYFLNKEEDIVEVEMKDIMGRFANDVIATCAFGVKCDSVKDKDNTFYKMGKKAIASTVATLFKAFFQMLFPTIAKKLKVSIIPNDASTFFDNAIRETLQLRKEKNIIRRDMIHILMQAQKGRETTDENNQDVGAGFAAVEEHIETSTTVQNVERDELAVEDIIAQAFLFFVAGFETTSTALAHCLHELAVNANIQKRLQREIDDELAKCGGHLTYEILTGMKYLDMVFSETLRKWPPAGIISRLCVKDYLIEGDEKYGEKSFLLPKNLGLFIPVYGIHMDPKYYPNPKKFDPERFSDENKDKIVPYSYMPFGVGPRNCIGSRFALVEAKTLLIYMLSKFYVVPTAKTEIPLKLSPKTTAPCPEGFWLGLKKRQAV